MINPALVFVLAAVMGVTGHYLLTTPALAEQQTLKEQAAAVHAQYLTAQSKVAELPALRVQTKQAVQDAETAKNRFPAEESLGVLISRLQDAAEDRGLMIRSLSRTVKPAPLPGFTEVNLNVQADGRLPGLVQFLAWTGEEQRVLSVWRIDSQPSAHTLSVTGYTRAEGGRP